MMKHRILIPVLGIASAGLAGAQGLYNIMPFDDDPIDSIPLHWTVGASVGYDDNPSPYGSDVSGYDSDEAGYISAFLQGNLAVKNPQTTWDAWARLGLIYYFDEIKQTDALGLRQGSSDDTFFNPSGGFNLTHHFNERLRFRSRTNLAYEMEPDYDYGLATDRRVGQYFRYSTDNSLGYAWTERFGTVTGARINGVTYDDVDNQDYINYTFYNQFRYRTSPTTVLTASFRYAFTDNDRGGDSDSQYYLVGAEHEFSPNTVGVIRVGAQYYSPDNGDSNWSPYLESTLRTRVNEKFGLRAFVYYGLVGRQNSIWTNDAIGLTPAAPATLVYFDERKLLRIGTQGSYDVSPTLSIFGGANLIYESYEDGTNVAGGLPIGTSAPDFDETLYNLNIGASYRILENLYLTGSYNYTNSTSDSDLREYDRNRVQLGVQATF
jgi:hypothetical protein